jgi:hypothetical protein
MNRLSPWEKLVLCARRAPPDEVTVPVGFATRVAARGLTAAREPADFFGVLELRALFLALVVMAFTAVATYPLLTRNTAAAEEENDPVGELVAQL